MKKIVLTSVIVDDPDVEQRIVSEVKGFELVYVPNNDDETFYEEIKTADAVIVADKVLSAEAIESMENCKVIIRQGTGIDTIDISKAKEKEIVVCNVPHYLIEEVSEFTVALVLMLNRHIIDYNNHTREGVWDIHSVHNISKYPPMRRSSNLVLGIVGLGRIGKLVAKKAKVFGFKLISYDPYVKEDDVKDLGVKMVDFDTLLRESDFVTLNLPLNDETYHMIDGDSFSKMKLTAYLVNAGRGPLVNEEALYRALKYGEIAGAAIDVTETEPLRKDNKLYQFDNLIVTPHAAFFTEDSFLELRERTIKAAIRVLNGEEPINQVN